MNPWKIRVKWKKISKGEFIRKGHYYFRYWKDDRENNRQQEERASHLKAL